MGNIKILGINVTDRAKNAVRVQELLTEYGCFIKTRIGLHQVTKDMCSPDGLIILECYGNERKCDMLEKKLRALDGVEVQKMVFSD